MDILLIPGALATAKFWHNQEHHFEKKVRIHHAPDLSGQTIAEMAENISNHLPKKFTLIAFSLGGYVALELMRQIPHQIEKLVLINAGASAVCEKGQVERERSLDLINKGKFDFLVNLIFKNSIHDKNKHPELFPLLKSMAHTVGAERYIQQLTAILNKPDQTDVLKGIQCPTLLMTSQEDKVMPPERSEHMAAHIKNSQLVYVENCGHMAPLEQPDTINRILSGWL
ncbi:MAG TPA: alpha/beta hydrolase [Legionella sp.]|nr:alpha/beta hydrolase [Legionella sp.]